MGTLSQPSAWTMLHLLLSSSLLALATAEADPQLLYGAVGLPYAGVPVSAVAHVPVVKSDVVTPAEVEHEVTAHTVPVAVGYHGFGYYGKRSADAEPEADADAYYGYYGYGYRGYRGYYGHPYAYYGKRSADAEPAVLAGASRVVSAPTPLIHNPPALPVAYAHPLAYAGYAAHPLAYHGFPVLAPAAAPAAEEAVVAERKKREADPQVLLNSAVLPYATPLAAPATFATVGAVAHAPVVKSVVDSPAEVSHEVTAHTVPVAVGYHGLPYW